ncbi:MAG: hypothetical protein ACOCUI_00195 [bacterium]
MKIEKVVEVLNDLLDIDREAISLLIEQRVPINEDLADHPTAMCVAETIDEEEIYEIGLLGILQAIASLDNARIIACYGEGGELEKFAFQSI